MNSHRYTRILIIAVLLLLTICAPAMADIVSLGDDYFVLDEAGVLSEDTEGEIFFSNKLLEEACGAQIVVVAIDSTGSVPIDDYAYTLFNEWGIGSKNDDNGFLLLMAVKDEDYYAVAGTGLDFRFSSGIIGDYLDRYLEPDFAKGDYDSGAKLFFEAAFKRISDACNAGVSVKDGIEAYEAYKSDYQQNSIQAAPGALKKADNENKSNASLLPVIIGIVILLIIFSSRKKRQRTVFTDSRPNNRRSFTIPFLLGRMTGNRRNYYGSYQRPHRNDMHFGGFGGHAGFPNRSGFGRSRPDSGFGSSRSSFGGSARSSFGGSRSGFGGARGGGGSTRGGGAGRGRR